MTISPSSKDKDHNIKPRQVYCPNCKVSWITDEQAPKCENCRSSAITVVKSVINELAQRHS